MPAEHIDLLILDVDGVLTDGTITPGADGEVSKAFYVQDGYAIKTWMKCGKSVAILSGRSEPTVKLRAKELGIKSVMMGISDKGSAFQEFVASVSADPSRVAYVGDDYPDLNPMRKCGCPVAVANAVASVKRVAAYVSRAPGGEGAVAEIVEMLLRRQGLWNGESLAETK